MIGFYLGRLLGDDAALARHSLQEKDVLAELSDKTVAIVGNARALVQTKQGARIDAADIVIRLNAAPMPSSRSHGARTDWLAISTPVPQAVIEARAPTVLLWMTRKRRRLPWRVVRDPRFFLNPRGRASALAEKLRAPPTTGAMVIDLVAGSDARKITLHGFDFFTSKSLSGRRDTTQVPHDFEAERNWVEALSRDDPRLIIVPTSERG